MASVTALLIAFAIPPCARAADKAFGGEDAGYIDWDWKNCRIVSTEKQHGLVDQARTKSNDAFQRGYEAQYRKVVDTTPTPVDVRRVCESVRGWYGSLGSKISDLVVSKVDRPSVAGTSVGPKGSAGSASGGGRGMGDASGGRRGGQ